MVLRVGWQTIEDRSNEPPEQSGKDPAIFATALETLAVKAFGDMGQTDSD